jgi:hypothetical protein
LQALLLQQRLWAINQQRKELNGNFTRLAQLAGELHKIFHAYAEILKPLVELDNLAHMQISEEPVAEAAGDAGPLPPVVAESMAPGVSASDQPGPLLAGKAPARLLAVLIKHGACSPARAATLARLNQDKTDKHLERLAQANIIERTGPRRNSSYQISASFVQRYLASLQERAAS